MSAVCALSASCSRTGAADEEIWTDRGSLPCSCSASILTILPASTVTLTCALPYCVGIASPVAVPEMPLLPDVVAVAPAEAVAVAVAVADVLVVAVEAVAVGSAGVCGWKGRTPAGAAAGGAGAIRGRGVGRVPLQKGEGPEWGCRS